MSAMRWFWVVVALLVVVVFYSFDQGERISGDDVEPIHMDASVTGVRRSPLTLTYSGGGAGGTSTTICTSSFNASGGGGAVAAYTPCVVSSSNGSTSTLNWTQQ